MEIRNNQPEGEGREMTRERRGKGKKKIANRRLMGMDNGGD